MPNDTVQAAASNTVRIDCGLLYALNGMRRFEAAKNRAADLGPDLFPPGAARWVAATIITGDALIPPLSLDHSVRTEIQSLVREMNFTTLPHDEAWAVYLVNLLAEHSHVPLLAGSLRWAANEVEQRRTLRWIRQKVNEAFDVAQGIDATTSAILFVGGGK